MASLSLGEAAEKAGASKVDIWRAIREGTLSAKKTTDGGFVIEASDLFRVFEPRPEPGATERPPLEEHPSQEKSAQPDAAPLKAEAEPPETALTNDIAVAFAALEAELKGILAQDARSPAKG